MRARRFRQLGLAAAISALVCILWPSTAWANPVVASTPLLGVGWVLLIPIVFVEAAVAVSVIGVRFWEGLRLSFWANLLSTFVGFPITLIPEPTPPTRPMKLNTTLELPIYDIILISLAHDVSGIPTAGKRQIIVAAVKNVLHFRIFDSDGQMIVDTDETELTTQAGPIKDLRKQLETLRPAHKLTESEKAGIITAITSIDPPSKLSREVYTTAEINRERFAYEMLYLGVLLPLLYLVSVATEGCFSRLFLEQSRREASWRWAWLANLATYVPISVGLATITWIHFLPGL